MAAGAAVLWLGCRRCVSCNLAFFRWCDQYVNQRREPDSWVLMLLLSLPLHWAVVWDSSTTSTFTRVAGLSVATREPGQCEPSLSFPPPAPLWIPTLPLSSCTVVWIPLASWYVEQRKLCRVIDDQLVCRFKGWHRRVVSFCLRLTSLQYYFS